MTMRRKHLNSRMKIFHLLLLVVLCESSVLAQPVLRGRTNVVVTNVVTGTNLDDVLRRRLRQAMTNPGAPEFLIATNVPAIGFQPMPGTNAPGATNVVGFPLAVPPATSVVTVPPGQTNAPNVAAAVPLGPPAPEAVLGPPAPGGPLIAGAPPAPGQTNAPAVEETFQLNFPNMPLDQALDIYASYVNRTLLRLTQLAGIPQTITIKTQTNLTKEEAIQALKAVFAMNGLTLIEVGEKFVKVVPSAQGPQEAAPFSDKDADKMNELGQYITKIVMVKNIKPSGVVQALTVLGNPKNPQNIVALDDNNMLVLRDFEPNIKRMLELIQKIDVLPELDYKLEVIPIKYGRVEEIYDVMSQVIGGGGGAGGAIAPRTTASRSASRGTRGTRQSSYPGAPNQPFQPQQTPQPTAGGAQNQFQRNLERIARQAAGEGPPLLTDARITPDQRSNSLIVYANKQDMVQLTNIVAKVDVLLAQVMIEAIIVDVKLGDSRDLGISYLQRPQKIGNWTTAGGVNNGQSFLSSITNGLSSGLPTGFSYFGKLNDDFEVTLRALASDNKAEVLQTPRIQTSHAVPANFFNGETVPYIQSTYYGGGFGGGPSSSFQQLEVGISLEVTPYITPDDLVVMEVHQTVDEISGATAIAGVGDVPNTTKREATSTVSVRNGDTILLGGFIRTKKERNKSGVPYLKDIPLLGNLFRSRTDKHDRSELLVLLRPVILPTPQQAALAATEERHRLPGVRQAEKDFQELEEKLNRQTDSKLKK
jgi:general secretion pathway protein D